MNDDKFRRLSKKRGELVLKKYLHGLSCGEEVILESLTEKVDEETMMRMKSSFVGLERLIDNSSG